MLVDLSLGGEIDIEVAGMAVRRHLEVQVTQLFVICGGGLDIKTLLEWVFSLGVSLTCVVF